MIDSFADKVTIKNTLNVEHDGKVRGDGQISSFATKADVDWNPASNQFFRNGSKVDSFATKADVNEKPQKGWNSADTPMSERAIRQSK